MKITKIRNLETGAKLPTETLEMISEALQVKLGAEGFLTEVSPCNGSALKLSLGGRCFSVDTVKLGYNASVPFVNHAGYTYDNTGIKGYKRTQN